MGLENPTHWIPIVVVLLLVFGARRLPEIGRSLGEGMRGFKDSLTGDHKESLNAGPAQQQPAPTPQSQQAAAPQAPASPEPPAPAG